MAAASLVCVRPRNVRESPSLSKPATVAHLLRKIYIDTQCISKK